MTQLNLNLPVIGDLNATEDPKIRTALSDIQTVVNALDNTNIAANADINATKLLDSSIATAKLADLAISTAKIADNGVTAAKIAAGAVGASEIADGTVGTSEIADSAVTTAKIANGTIATADLADGAVTGDKITASYVTSQADLGGTSKVAGTHSLSGALTLPSSGIWFFAVKLEARAVSTNSPAVNSFIGLRQSGTDVAGCSFWLSSAEDQAPVTVTGIGIASASGTWTPTLVVQGGGTVVYPHWLNAVAFRIGS